MTGYRLLTVAALLTLVGQGVGASEFHVARYGDDANPGTPERPFATLERGREAVRRLTQSATLTEPVAIIVHSGVYRIRESLVLGGADAGRKDARVVWQAAPGDEVRLCGGRSLSADTFIPVADEKVLNRLDPPARGKVLQTELRDVDDEESGRFPDSFRGAPAVPELFFNDRRMTLARWPNEGWATISRIVDPGSTPSAGDASGRPGTFEYSGDRPARWNVTTGVWLLGYWCYDWYEEAIRVETLDRDKRQITLALPANYGIRQGNPSPRRYRALNLLEELDEPGEYYLDRAAGVLYFWPPAEITDARIVLSTLNAPLVWLQDTSHVTWRGFIIEAGLGDGLAVTGGQDNRIESCVVRNTRQVGIRVSGGTGHRVEGCDIHDTGTGGLVLEGGDRKTLTPGGHVGLNNHIWRFSQHQLCYASGITLSGVGNRAAHNVLHDAPHMAIGIGGNDHVFEYNIVHDVCNASDDAGALYKGRNPSCRGNVIRYNVWRDIGSPMGHGTAAVYFDDGDGGDTVFGNIFVRCGYPGQGSFGTVFSHGGHDNTAENNIFIECQRALGSAPWGDQRWKETIDGGHGCYWQKLLLEEVDITGPPYTSHYPALVGFMDPQPGQPRFNHARNNVLVRCGQLSSGNWVIDADATWITDQDPGFVDAAHGDYRLRDDAELYQRLPGFQRIPVEKIGAYPSPLRSSWPIEIAVASTVSAPAAPHAEGQVGSQAGPRRLDIRSFGAVADGTTLNTAAIQQAIDACHAAGGGQVVIPEGEFLTGTVRLKSHVTLKIETGATLRASPDIRAYDMATAPLNWGGWWEFVSHQLAPCLIYAEDAEQVGVVGNGTVDGQGGRVRNVFPNAGDSRRPMLMRFQHCQGVTLRNVTLLDPASFTTFFVRSRDIAIEGVTIRSRQTGNGDGLDFDGCRNVRISGCDLDCGDDAISTKTLHPDWPNEHFTITDCRMKSEWAAIRLGPESIAPMRHFKLHDCVFTDCRDGIKIESCEGTCFEDLEFSGIEMREVNRPLYVTATRFGFSAHGHSSRPPVGRIRGLRFTDIRATARLGGAELPFDRTCAAVVSLPGYAIEDIAFSDVTFVFPGGGAAELASRLDVAELLHCDDYMDWARPFDDDLPASVLYLRHLRDVRLERVELSVERPDMRPFIAGDDVDGITLQGVVAHGPAAVPGLAKLADAQRVTTRDCRLQCDPPAPILIGPTPEEQRRLTELRRESAELDRALQQVADAVDAATKAAPLLKLPDTWDFRPDPPSEGESAGWFAAAPDANWSRLRVDQPWSRQGFGDLRGSGWYAVEFTVSPEAVGRRLFIRFGAVNGTCRAWIDGQLSGERMIDPAYVKNFPWALNLSDSLRPSASHRLVVKVVGTNADAGLTGPVELRQAE